MDVDAEERDSARQCTAREGVAGLRGTHSRAETVVRAGGAPSIEERVGDEARFFRAWFENPLRTGAVSPSGRFLSRMMARYVDPAADGLVVELGPGTGPVTLALLQRGIAPERLVLVEFDAAFCRLLSRRFPNCRVVQGDAYDLGNTLADLRGQKVAAVVSSLPLLTRPEPDRNALLAEAFAMMGPGGRFVQFTYGMVSPVPCQTRRGKPSLYAGEASPPVWLNLPPARVWIYRDACEAAPARPARPQGQLMRSLRKRTVKMRVGLIVTRDKVETEIRASAARARQQIAIRAQKARNDKALQPAFALLKKISEPKRRG